MSIAIDLTHNVMFAIAIRIAIALTIAIALHMTTSRGVIIIMSDTYKYHISVIITIIITNLSRFANAIIDSSIGIIITCKISLLNSVRCNVVTFAVCG